MAVTIGAALTAAHAGRLATSVVAASPKPRTAGSGTPKRRNRRSRMMTFWGEAVVWLRRQRHPICADPAGIYVVSVVRDAVHTSHRTVFAGNNALGRDRVEVLPLEAVRAAGKRLRAGTISETTSSSWVSTLVLKCLWRSALIQNTEEHNWGCSSCAHHGRPPISGPPRLIARTVRMHVFPWSPTVSVVRWSRSCAGGQYVINSTVWHPVVANGEPVNGRTV